MEYRRMGKSGLQLSVVSFGSWITFHKQIEDSTADELMGIAYDAGINFFDNAEVYAQGESEKMMGRVLRKKNWDRTSYVVSSKAFFGWHGKATKPNQSGLSRKHLTEACNEALQRLQTDYLDLYFCHRPDKNVPIEEVVWTMTNLIQQGKILYWGTSEWSAQEIMEAHVVATKNNLIGPSVEQPEYNMFHREKIENEFLQLYSSVGLGTTIWSPLASGVLTGKYTTGVPADSRMAIPGFEWLKERALTQEKITKAAALQLIANELNTSLAILSIAWCIKNKNVTTAILGATQKKQLEENIKAVALLDSVSTEVMNKIEAVLNNKPIIPEY